MTDPSDSAERVRQLNDAFRRSFVGGVVVVTAGFETLPAERRRVILAKIRAFDAFDEDKIRTASTTSVLLRSAAFAASGRSIITTKRWN
jgi:hypothetical protein